MVVLTAGFILQSITIKKHISLMQKVDFRGFSCISATLLVCTQCMLPVCALVSQSEKTLKKGNHILNTASVKKATL